MSGYNNEELADMLHRASIEIGELTEKLGEVALEAIMREDNFGVNIASGIISTFQLCNTQKEYDIADSMLAGICGYGIAEMLDCIRKRDRMGYSWESCKGDEERG